MQLGKKVKQPQKYVKIIFKTITIKQFAVSRMKKNVLGLKIIQLNSFI